MEKNFPDVEDLYEALCQSDRPLTTIEAHRAACEVAGLPAAAWRHGSAGTMVRLDRMFHLKRITFKRNENGAVIWYVPGATDE